MKSVESFIAPQSVRVVAGTLLPGIAALGPYFALGYSRFGWLNEILKQYPWAIVASIITLGYLGGLVISSIGCQIEEWIVNFTFRSETERQEMTTAWQSYLRSNTDTNAVGHKYLGLLVTWMKFNTSMIPAALTFIIGLHIHNTFWTSLSCGELTLITFLVVLLVIWLTYRTVQSVKELHDVRMAFTNSEPSKKTED